MQVEVGKNYSFEATQGILVVAYPNKDVNTTFQFKYWVDSYTDLTWTEMI